MPLACIHQLFRPALRLKSIRAWPKSLLRIFNWRTTQTNCGGVFRVIRNESLKLCPQHDLSPKIDAFLRMCAINNWLALSAAKDVQSRPLIFEVSSLTTGIGTRRTAFPSRSRFLIRPML